MYKNLFLIVLLIIGFQIISGYVEPQDEIPEQKSLDIKIFGRKIKLNILEIKGDFRGKDDQILENLTEKLNALKRKKRSAQSSGKIDSIKILFFIMNHIRTRKAKLF